MKRMNYNHFSEIGDDNGNEMDFFDCD